MLRKIQGVSFPRSGFNLLAHMLLNYFSGDPMAKVNTEQPNIAGDFGYCEFYKHCNQTPCTDPQVTFQKSHDFGLEMLQSDELDYMVLYREPLPAIISFFEAELAWGNIAASNDNFEFWERYFRKRLEYYQMFKKKWVDDAPAKSHVIKYEDLTSKPGDIFHALVEWMAPTRQADRALINRIVECRKVKSTRKPEDFRYYSNELQQRIDDSNRILPVRIEKRFFSRKKLQRTTK